MIKIFFKMICAVSFVYVGSGFAGVKTTWRITDREVCRIYDQLLVQVADSDAQVLPEVRKHVYLLINTPALVKYSRQLPCKLRELKHNTEMEYFLMSVYADIVRQLL